MKSDIKGTLEAMQGFPVTIRLLDPPLHEFIPREEKQQTELAQSVRDKPGRISKNAPMPCMKTIR